MTASFFSVILFYLLLDLDSLCQLDILLILGYAMELNVAQKCILRGIPKVLGPSV